jgi:hypothetical protein
MHKLARCVLFLGLAGGVGLGLGVPTGLGSSCGSALAESKVDESTTQKLKETDPVPPATGESKAEQAGTQEPSTKGPGSDGKSGVFENGSLVVPGAPTDTETAPAKFSERNAASDRLPTVAFRLKNLTTEQRHEIYRQLTEHRSGLALSPGGGERYAQLGAELPSHVVLDGELTAMPEALAARFPALRGTAFMKAGSAVLIVELHNRQVIGVLPAP